MFAVTFKSILHCNWGKVLPEKVHEDAKDFQDTVKMRQERKKVLSPSLWELSGLLSPCLLCRFQMFSAQDS